MDDSGLQAGDVRSRTTALIRERQDELTTDIVSQITGLGTSLDSQQLRGCAELLLRLFATSVDGGALDTGSAAMRDLARYCPPVTTRQFLDAAHDAARVILDDVALDDRLGATSAPWAIVAHTFRRATLISSAHTPNRSPAATCPSPRATP